MKQAPQETGVYSVKESSASNGKMKTWLRISEHKKKFFVSSVVAERKDVRKVETANVARTHWHVVLFAAVSHAIIIRKMNWKKKTTRTLMKVMIVKKMKKTGKYWSMLMKIVTFMKLKLKITTTMLGSWLCLLNHKYSCMNISIKRISENSSVLEHRINILLNENVTQTLKSIYYISLLEIYGTLSFQGNPL